MSHRTVTRLCVGLSACLALAVEGSALAQQAASPLPGAPAPVVSAAEALSAAPKAQIANGVLSASVLLPDPVKGFYRGVRFDWSGMISSLTYRGQEYYGLWFDRISPDVRDFAFNDGLITVGPNTAAMGPADAYDPSQPVGWAEAPAGGTFLKIGVGLLRKPADGAAYSSFRRYDWVDQGVWKAQARRDRIVFTHTVFDANSGYGYIYRKELRLLKGRPVLEIRHSLKNTGTRPISSTTFNHNFLTLGGAPAQPGLQAGATFPLEPVRPLRDVVERSGTTVTYKRALGPLETFSTPFAVGPGASAYDIHVRAASGAGFRVQSDRPMTNLALWSIRSTVSFEPFISLTANPGQTTAWIYTYSYTAPL